MALRLQCIIQMNPLEVLHNHALMWHYKKGGHYIFQQKIPSLKNMMEDLKIFFKKYMRRNLNLSLKRKISPMNIV